MIVKMLMRVMCELHCLAYLSHPPRTCYITFSTCGSNKGHVSASEFSYRQNHNDLMHCLRELIIKAYMMYTLELNLS